MLEIPEYMIPVVQQTLYVNQDTAERHNLWAVILGLAPFKDGDMWCVVWGENIQEGICGFGKTPYEAMVAFEKAMTSTTTA